MFDIKEHGEVFKAVKAYMNITKEQLQFTKDIGVGMKLIWLFNRAVAFVTQHLEAGTFPEKKDLRDHLVAIKYLLKQLGVNDVQIVNSIRVINKAKKYNSAILILLKEDLIDQFRRIVTIFDSVVRDEEAIAKMPQSPEFKEVIETARLAFETCLKGILK